MKRKRYKPEQFSFERCIQHVMDGTDDEAKQYIRDTDPVDLHHDLGRWIRNTCGLWEHGTDHCVDDIVREYKAGRLKCKALDEHRFTHAELEFPLDKAHDSLFDTSLTHPDNCSGVIIEAVKARLQDGA